MHTWAVDDFLWIIGDTGKVVLLAILLGRRLYRTFPIFVSYVLWDLISDLFVIWVQLSNHGFFSRHYAVVYYSASIITYLLVTAALLEIAANVLRPAAMVFSRRMLYVLLTVILAVSCCSFFLAKWINPAPFLGLRVFLVISTIATLLSLITFVMIAGFSQILGLTWKNHVLQSTTGLAFYSVVSLLTILMLSRLRAGASYAAQYRFWTRFQVVGYFCTLSFWCYAFLKQEAPRKEFSPQMQKILVQLSGSAKRQTAVLARSREP